MKTPKSNIINFATHDCSVRSDLSRHLLAAALGLVAPGEKVPASIWRDGAAKTVDVVVKELPGQAQLAKNGSSQSDANDTLQGVGAPSIRAAPIQRPAYGQRR